MVGDYISREAALTVLDWDCASQDALEAIKSIPTADVVEVRYCSFNLEEARRRESVYKCSNCGNYLTVRADTLNGGRGDLNYCPFCGRKVMHGGQDGGPDGGLDGGQDE